ncbi:MAG TPA: non-ribosomal peptide synthetase [Candidatus Kapabacteria bacterium]|nr:non-ribosomal peptide synthetase [Candidatus Kapabacteria bacterium]
MNIVNLASYIKKHALMKPASIAIKAGQTMLSYRDLERQTNRIANFFEEKIFRDASGSIGENVYVCLIFDRSAEIIASIIGLLKAGLVFVPVSPHIPEKRIQLLLEETKTQWVITSSEYLDKFQALFARNKQINTLTMANFENQDDELRFEMRYNKYCYVYFTSGSTGIPKGVLGRQKSLQHFIEWEIKQFGIDSTFHVSQLTPPTFDPYLRDIFVPLLAGGTICIPDYNTMMSPAKLVTWINENKISLIHIVPSLFKLISQEAGDPGHFLDLKYILLAGEMLRGNDIRKFIATFNDRIQLVNIYGPTETTLAKFFYIIQAADVTKSIIPVGKAIEGAEALILDEQGQKCLTGNIGEIHIRTPYISSGYFNNKELNKKVFIKNPFSNDKNDTIYKTGDMGRMLFDGNIELTGRLDGQIKLRGNRVETGEIENLLLNLNYIKEAVVVEKEDINGEKFLCAFLIAKSSDRQENFPDTNELKRILSQNLPAYMLPSYFIPLESMPLNPNGKINKDALRKMNVSLDTGETYIAPRDELEKTIAGIWKEVLKIDKIGINDNFFNIGGTSLSAIQVNSRIGEMFGAEIPIVKFFEFPTIRSYVNFRKNDSPGKSEKEETNLKRMENMARKRSAMTLRKQKIRESRNE